MKSLSLLSIFTVVILFLTGCNNIPFDSHAEEEARAMQIKSAAQTCCQAGKYESGYYYNGYQENGWRYCVIQLR